MPKATGQATGKGKAKGKAKATPKPKPKPKPRPKASIPITALISVFTLPCPTLTKAAMGCCQGLERRRR